MTPQAKRIYDVMLSGEWMGKKRIQDAADIKSDAYGNGLIDAVVNPLWELMALKLVIKRKNPDHATANQYMRLP